MQCETCKAEGKTSKVYVPMYGASTSMGWQDYYDEEGVYHSHDPNLSSRAWSCSNGHEWSTSTRSSCPAPNCEWNDRK